MMNLKISDLTERNLALDPSQSFIIQAPAGSGKTTLLVQRYLKLLSLVNNPEELVAITFTRKAAFEMQRRIIEALKKSDNHIPPKNPYEASIQTLARKALEQNKTKKWNILLNPQRLRIKTIDAWCYFLVNQAPILTKINSSFKLVQNQEAQRCYRKTAKALLANLEDPQYAKHLERLLLHLGNNWQRAEKLLITMLNSREQWLPYIVGLKTQQELRQKMEEALQNIFAEHREQFSSLFPQELLAELTTLLEFADTNSENSQPSLATIKLPENLSEIDQVNLRNLASFLLTKEFNWRKKITKKQGFSAPSTKKSKKEQELCQTMKNRMATLLNQLSEHEELRLNLENLSCSPPLNYTDQQWEMVETMLELLPLLAAQLKVILNEELLIDYAEISMAALRTLGDQELPSNLALNLDYRLQHLLIDEFQDTSLSQYRLLEKLTTNWQEHDGRTIFIVGDPMQSIYRFREAEVGLFLRAQHEGIGALKLQPLTLTTNFRATATMINWINHNFTKIMPVIADIAFGAIPFSASTAVIDHPESQIKINLLTNGDDGVEAEEIIRTIQKIEQQTPNDTITILVKSRTHLPKIILALRRANLAYQAFELETLKESSSIRDLFSLTRAIFDLTDRIAWIAILRAPWCGLTLQDLHKIANGKNELIWDNICNDQELDLSEDGRVRLNNLKTNLTLILLERARRSWHELIEKSWLLLGGPATANSEEELSHAEIYLELLQNNPFDLELLQTQLESLYIPSSSIAAKIQIMTIHKAKGLEFDHLIIPGLNRPTRLDEHRLMLWYERPKLHHGSDLLLAPIAAAGNHPDQIYQYLQSVLQKKSFYETGRLLYVAMTRAKKSIQMIGCIKDRKEKNTPSANIQTGSLLEQLKPCWDESWLREKIADKNPSITIDPKPSSSSRLKLEWELPIKLEILAKNNPPNWQVADNQSSILGTVIHHCLRKIADEKLNSEQLITQYPYWHKLLKQAGYIEIDAGLKLVNLAISSTLEDERGQWILAKHREASSEFAISTTVNNQLEHYMIDRTFIDETGSRWIIDYKISQPLDQKNVAEFLIQEQTKYEKQLKNYAKALLALDPTTPIKLALYFPLFKGWIEIKLVPIT